MTELEPVVDPLFHERIVGTTEHEGVNLRIFSEYLTQVSADELLGAGSIVFAGLDEWHPERASLLSND